MTTIKVTYESTIRRFSIPSTMTWSDLESGLREIFSLPHSFNFSLSYTDEDGDVITLSTDLELQEFLSSQSPQSVLKFTLVPNKEQSFDNDFSSDSSENDLLEKFISATDNLFGKSNNDATPPNSTSKGKQKEEPATESSTSTTADEQQQDHAPSIEQFQALFEQYKDVIEENPQLIEQTNLILEQILKNIPVDINQWVERLSAFKSEVQTDAQEGNSREQYDEFPSSFLSPQTLLSSHFIQRIVEDFRKFARDGPFNFNGGQQQGEELSQETLKEKLNILHSMGFWEDDAKNEKLLRKYNGVIERVVEMLIKQKGANNSEFYNSTEGIVGK